MTRFALAGCLLAGAVSLARADDRPAARPITEAEAVLAVYRNTGGLRAPSEPQLILAVWPDGRAVWSGDRLRGGPPYSAGEVDPKKVAALLARFDRDGLFADEGLNQAHFGPDSQFHTVLVKSGKKQVKMESWHEVGEESDGVVATSRGLSALEGRRRLDVLRQEPAEYLYFRAVWSETRARLADLLPAAGKPVAGQAVKEAGELSWQEKANGRPKK